MLIGQECAVKRGAVQKKRGSRDDLLERWGSTML